MPEMVSCLRGHTGLVKGLTWDPVGKYIASQADDHSLKVWRTVDWQMETDITKPFSEVRPPAAHSSVTTVSRVTTSHRLPPLLSISLFLFGVPWGCEHRITFVIRISKNE